MAIDKMVDSAKLDREMLATANALREKGKTEAEIPWEDEIGFEQAVLAIKGGGDLNFEVVASDTEPAKPSENMIWIKPEASVPFWVFDSNEPNNPEANMVWFRTSTSSNLSFNALSENKLIVSPERCVQYIGGSWVSIDAKTYLNGEWVDWWAGELFDNGKQYSYVTGGWIRLNASQWGFADAGSLSIGDTIAMSSVSGGGNSANGNCVHAGTANTIDFSGWDTLNITVSATGSQSWNPMLTTRNSGDHIEEAAVASYTISKTGTHSFPLEEAAKGKYYLVFGVANGRSATITRVWLSKGVS